MADSAIEALRKCTTLQQFVEFSEPTHWNAQTECCSRSLVKKGLEEYPTSANAIAINMLVTQYRELTKGSNVDASLLQFRSLALRNIRQLITNSDADLATKCILIRIWIAIFEFFSRCFNNWRAELDYAEAALKGDLETCARLMQMYSPASIQRDATPPERTPSPPTTTTTTPTLLTPSTSPPEEVLMIRSSKVFSLKPTGPYDSHGIYTRARNWVRTSFSPDHSCMKAWTTLDAEYIEAMEITYKSVVARDKFEKEFVKLLQEEFKKKKIAEVLPVGSKREVNVQVRLDHIFSDYKDEGITPIPPNYLIEACKALILELVGNDQSAVNIEFVLPHDHFPTYSWMQKLAKEIRPGYELPIIRTLKSKPQPLEPTNTSLPQSTPSPQPSALATPTAPSTPVVTVDPPKPRPSFFSRLPTDDTLDIKLMAVDVFKTHFHPDRPFMTAWINLDTQYKTVMQSLSGREKAQKTFEAKILELLEEALITREIIVFEQLAVRNVVTINYDKIFSSYKTDGSVSLPELPDYLVAACKAATLTLVDGNISKLDGFASVQYDAKFFNHPAVQSLRNRFMGTFDHAPPTSDTAALPKPTSAPAPIATSSTPTEDETTPKYVMTRGANSFTLEPTGDNDNYEINTTPKALVDTYFTRHNSFMKAWVDMDAKYVKTMQEFYRSVAAKEKLEKQFVELLKAELIKRNIITALPDSTGHSITIHLEQIYSDRQEDDTDPLPELPDYFVASCQAAILMLVNNKTSDIKIAWSFNTKQFLPGKSEVIDTLKDKINKFFSS